MHSRNSFDPANLLDAQRYFGSLEMSKTNLVRVRALTPTADFEGISELQWWSGMRSASPESWIDSLAEQVWEPKLKLRGDALTLWQAGLYSVRFFCLLAHWHYPLGDAIGLITPIHKMVGKLRRKARQLPDNVREVLSATLPLPFVEVLQRVEAHSATILGQTEGTTKPSSRIYIPATCALLRLYQQGRRCDSSKGFF